MASFDVEILGKFAGAYTNKGSVQLLSLRILDPKFEILALSWLSLSLRMFTLEMIRLFISMKASSVF